VRRQREAARELGDPIGVGGQRQRRRPACLAILRARHHATARHQVERQVGGQPPDRDRRSRRRGVHRGERGHPVEERQGHSVDRAHRQAIVHQRRAVRAAARRQLRAGAAPQEEARLGALRQVDQARGVHQLGTGRTARANSSTGEVFSTWWRRMRARRAIATASSR
jgi:hypothetical protein